MLRRMNAEQQKRQPNNFERRCYTMLKDLGISYKPQHTVNGRFTVDAWVPGQTLVIEFDGDYWHANPVRYPNPSARQQRQRNWDKAQDAYMTACGFTTVRVWESEMKKDSTMCRQRILRALQTDPG